MFLSLASEFKKAVSLVEDGTVRISSISNDPDRIVIVLRPAESENKGIDIVDLTDGNEPHAVRELEEAGSEPVKEKAAVAEKRDPNKPDEDGNVRCRFCGRTVTPRGRTRHENKCNHNPENEPNIGNYRKKKKKGRSS